MAGERAQRVIERLRAHRERFEAFCRSLSPEELERPVPNSSWTVKDFVSHLVSMDPLLGYWFRGVASGRLDEPTRDADGSTLDVDRWNNAEVARRRDWPLERLLQEGSGNREALVAVLEGISDEDTKKTVRFPGDSKRPPTDMPLGLFLSGWSRHDAMHAADMLKALPERASDPELVAWLDDPAVKWYQDTMAGPPRR
ncbi:MAG: maleylpyruvate isomerase N-terminal domain-containing protein [Chloroflexi bacterium]|nr:maleylpyruvate isomerase N-terminal domain-containing protein [Chloroflexota bacterium]